MAKNIIKKFVIFTINTLVLALFISQLPIPGFGTTKILSGFIAVCVLVFKWPLLKYKASFFLNREEFRISIVLLLFCFLIAIAHSFIGHSLEVPGNQPYEPQYIIYIIIFYVVLPLYCLISYDSLNAFAWSWIIIILGEAVIVIMSVINHDFAVYIFERFNGSERFIDAVEGGVRIVGIGVAGSSGGIAMSTGILALSLLLVKNEITTSGYFILSVIIILATLFVGRTGVLCAIVFVISSLFLSKQSLKVYIFIPLAIVFVLLGVNTLLSYTMRSDVLLNWMSQAFEREARGEVLNYIYEKTYNFDISLLGTGMSRGRTGDGLFCYSDSGYLQTYFAFGVLGFISYYLAIFLFLRSSMNILKGKTKVFLSIALIMTFALEFKEPFFMKNVFAFVIMALSLLSSSESLINGKRLFIQGV